MFASKRYSKDLRQHANTAAERGLPDGFICDINDGKAFVDMKDTHLGDRALRDTDVLVGVFSDGVQAYKDDGSYTLYPVALTAYNFSPDIRSGVQNICRSGFMPVHIRLDQ